MAVDTSNRTMRSGEREIRRAVIEAGHVLPVRRAVTCLASCSLRSRRLEHALFELSAVRVAMALVAA